MGEEMGEERGKGGEVMIAKIKKFIISNLLSNLRFFKKKFYKATIP